MAFGRHKPRWLLFLIAAVLSLLYWIQVQRRNASTVTNVNTANTVPLAQLVQPFKHCLTTDLEGDLWKNFSSFINRCAIKHTKMTDESFLKLHTASSEEIKYFLPMTEAFKNDDTTPCYWLTIGVGGDTQVEKEMKTAHPKCKMYGIEPSSDQHKDFDKYGTVIPHAVGVMAGTLTMRLLKKSDYVDEPVLVVPMHELVDKYVGSRLIHYATMDIGGFEYSILDALKYRMPIEVMGVQFCQIDAELYSLEQEAKQHVGKSFDFERYWMDFLVNSPYIPVRANDFSTHRKITLINIDEIVCQRLFNFQRYFSKHENAQTLMT